MKQFIYLIIVTLFLSACTSPISRWQEEINYQVALHAEETQISLKPFFKNADVNYPPQAIAFLIFKNKKILELWAQNKSNQWKYIRSYPIFAASGHLGPKLREGDYQVPEGVYHIVVMNPISHFHLSLKLDYPNSFDRAHAFRDGRHDLGGDVFIHGCNCSIGCIAIGDAAINQLFVLAYYAGIKNILVIIAPNDLRYQKAIYFQSYSPWLPELYQEIQTALVPFKEGL